MTPPDCAAKPKGQYVRVNDLTMYYETYGSGEPLILLHGSLDCTGAMWADQIPAFSKRFRVIVPDARGHGRTDNPRGEISIPLLAEDEMAFQRALGLEKPFVCGLSMGGMTALNLGMRHPDSIRALIVVGALVHRGFSQAMLDNLKAIGIEGPGVVDTELFERSDPQRVQRLREMHPQGHDYWKALLRQVSVMSRSPIIHDTSDYRKISAPTLIIIGDRDHIFRVDDAVEMYRLIPDAELAVIPQSGHGLFDAKSGLFEEIVLDFLARRREVP